MKTRAKFILKSIEQQKYTRYNDGKPEDVVTHTYKLQAVYSDGSEENKKFWEMTPAGEISLSCVKPQGWELGAVVYVDFEAGI